MCAQQNPVVDVEGILHIPCGVIRRKVQLCEVKIVIFDFGPFKGCEAQSNKRIADFAIYLGKRVELAGRQLDNARKGNVNGFVFNALLLCKCIKHCFSCFKCFGNGLFNLIGRFAELRAPFGREFAHCAQNSRQCAVSAQNGGVQFGQLFFAFDVLKPLKRVLTDFCKFVKHFVFLLYFSNQRNLFRKINQAHPSLRDECAFLVVPPCFTARNVPNASAKLRSQTATIQGCLKKTLSGLTRQRLHICPDPNPILSVNEPEKYRQT